MVLPIGAIKPISIGSLVESPTDVALQFYTSGTTGRQKGVLMSHAALVVNGLNTILSQKLSHEKATQLGRYELKPVPMLRGRFVDREGNPVGDVSITTPEGAPLASSDPAVKELGAVNE